MITRVIDKLIHLKTLHSSRNSMICRMLTDSIYNHVNRNIKTIIVTVVVLLAIVVLLAMILRKVGFNIKQIRGVKKKKGSN